MCCSTGVCGPEPNKELIELNETLKRLQKEFKELNAVRVSMSFNLSMFLENNDISQLVKENGLGVLPHYHYQRQDHRQNKISDIR